MADDNQKNADFIGRVVSDAKNPPETRMLTGWFGDSGEEGFRRLYTDAELTSYIDIPDDAILYSEPLRDVQPAGCALVWVKRDAALKQGGSAASRAARFLQGQVQQDFASAGAAGSLDQAGQLSLQVDQVAVDDNGQPEDDRRHEQTDGGTAHLEPLVLDFLNVLRSSTSVRTPKPVPPRT